jgi:tetratricopeptide (TPR) repeat protein
MTSRYRYQFWGVCALLLLGVVLIFGQTVRHEFVTFDDDRYVYDNPQIAPGLTARGAAWVFAHVHSASWHPLTGLSHLLDCQIYGLRAGGHHSTSVLLHAATAVLLFLVLRQMTGALWPSALVAAIFAVHPLRAESVAWISERKDVLSGLCFVLTLGAYTWYCREPQSWRRYLPVVAIFALGLMAKPMLVTLPFVLLLLDYWPLGRSASLRRLVVEKIPLFLLTALCCVVTVWVQASADAMDKHLSPWARGSTALVSYVAYLGQFFWPVGLAVLYPHPGDSISVGNAIGALLVLAGISAVAMAFRRRCPYLLVGWLWYLGMLVPVSGVAQAGSQARADRFTYLPQIGLCIALVWGAAGACRSRPGRRWLGGIGSALVLAALAGCAWRQASFWHDSEILWNRALACTSGNYMAHYNLGLVLAGRHRLGEAIDHYRLAMEIDPQCAESYNNMGVALVQLGRLDEALAQYRQAVAIRPDYAMARCNLGTVLANGGRTGEAIEQFHKALASHPDNALAHCRLGNVLTLLGRLAEASTQYLAALDIDPYDAEAHCNLGDVLARQGRLDEAMAHYQAAVDVQPYNVDAHCRLGNALACGGRFDEAVAEIQRALEIQPDRAAAHNSLALVLAARGRHDQAVLHYRRALELEPGNAEVQKNLAWLRATCPEKRSRNGAEAVQLAEQANRSTGGKRPDMLDTLAAAYAESGWFPEAVAAQRKSLESAKPETDRAAGEVMRARLALYEAGQPYRQMPTVAAPLPANR